MTCELILLLMDQHSEAIVHYVALTVSESPKIHATSNLSENCYLRQCPTK
jgi:hypothetical protein